MKRTRRSCVAVSNIAATKSPKKSPGLVKEKTKKTAKKEKKAIPAPLDILVKKNMLSDNEMDSSSEENEIENQTPLKKTKGNDYLKMIEENRQKSLAFLKSLNIDEVKDSFCSSIKALKPDRGNRLLNKKPKNMEPVRKSERLSKVYQNLSEDALIRKVIAEAKMVNEEKPAKIFPDKFKFDDSVVKKEELSNFEKHFSDLDYKDPPKPIQFPDHFKRMKSKESLVKKVVPFKVTALRTHPSVNQVIVAAGSSHGYIGLWNVTSNSTCMFECHNEGVIHLKFNTYDPHKLISSSYDGRLLCGDMEKLTFEKYYGRDDDYCTCFDILSSSTFIVGHSCGDVAIVDSRAYKNCFKTHKCHVKRIKRLSVHPVDTNCFASSDSRGSIKVWDLRNLREEPLCESKHHTRCVSSVYFSPVTGKYILSTSLDDQLCILIALT